MGRANPQEQSGGPRRANPQATRREAVPLLEGHLVETVEVTWSQQTPENGHIHCYWKKVIKSEACVLWFAMIPEVLLLHYLANFMWGGLALGLSLRAAAAAGSN